MRESDLTAAAALSGYQAFVSGKSRDGALTVPREHRETWRRGWDAAAARAREIMATAGDPDFWHELRSVLAEAQRIAADASGGRKTPVRQKRLATTHMVKLGRLVPRVEAITSRAAPGE